MLKRFSYLLFCFLLISATANAANPFAESSEEEFLPPDQAFKLNVEAASSNALQANFTVVSGYYLYKERLKFVVAPGSAASIDHVELPQGEIKDDPNFGKMEVYHHDFAVKILLNNAAKTSANNLKISARYQGCSEKGLCYAPQTKLFDVAVPAQQANNGAASEQQDAVSFSEEDTIVNALKSGNWWLVLGVFFIAGFLLSLTPCVLPMIPILSSIIVGSHAKQAMPSKWHSFALSVAYVLGMALSYAIAGAVAGMTGNLVSQSLQSPWVLALTALLFVALALSMFGLYELKLPSAIENRFLAISQKQSGGQLAGVFIMGVISALIVSPCVAAPLAFALIYIGQTHNILLGGLGLFALAIGMGVPLLLVGASAGSVLPKPGKWMTFVRNAFGVVMLLMAAYIAWPILPQTMTQPVNQVLGLNTKHLPFTRIKSVADLNNAIKNANGKIVMLDFYADWCTSCKEMEKLTFSEKTVQTALKSAVLLQVDVTNQTADDVALQKRLGIVGPPSIIFFNRSGVEIKPSRVAGYQNANKFLKVVNQVNALKPNECKPLIVC